MASQSWLIHSQQGWNLRAHESSYLRCHCHWLDEQQATRLHGFSRVLSVIKNNVSAYVFRSEKIEEQLIIAVQAGIAIFK